jgi:ribosomal protein L11 methyltransferase
MTKQVVVSVVPYRIDVRDPPTDAFDRLVELGALDIEPAGTGLAAIVPDTVAVNLVARALGGAEVQVSPAIGRDDNSVWRLAARAVRTRTLVIVPAGQPAAAGTLRLVDGPAFGTGLHATTGLCLEVLEDLLEDGAPDRMLDVGTGSGVLALAALRWGVGHVAGLDTDAQALVVAAENAALNDLGDRLLLVRGGPEAIRGSWPLVVANIRAAELIAMSATLARLMASRGHLVLSGIPQSVVPDVRQAYRRLGMLEARVAARDGWTTLVFRPTW